MAGWNRKIIQKIKPWVQTLKGHWLWDATAAVCKSTVIEKGYFLGLSSWFPPNTHLSSTILSRSFCMAKQGSLPTPVPQGCHGNSWPREGELSSRISADGQSGAGGLSQHLQSAPGRGRRVTFCTQAQTDSTHPGTCNCTEVDGQRNPSAQAAGECRKPPWSFRVHKTVGGGNTGQGGAEGGFIWQYHELGRTLVTVEGTSGSKTTCM